MKPLVCPCGHPMQVPNALTDPPSRFSYPVDCHRCGATWSVGRQAFGPWHLFRMRRGGELDTAPNEVTL